ncbi:MAG: hydrogenase assembly protein HupF [Acidimicrobiales bacterium]|jgi:hypothetical protein
MTSTPTPDAPASSALSVTLSDDLAMASLAMARRFAEGATLWCVAPAWPEHAHHVAGDFAHRVISGQKPLPAVAVVDTDPVGRLRQLVHSGDLLLALSAADEGEVAAVMRRAPAWGLATIWVGSGVRPEPGAADHVLWVDAVPDVVDPIHDVMADTGELVLLCRHLREATHVYLERPGLIESADPAACTNDELCVTCFDEGRLGEIVLAGAAHAAGKGNRSAVVRTPRGLEEIDTNLVGALTAGDLVIIHAGAAIGVVETSLDAEEESPR